MQYQNSVTIFLKGFGLATLLKISLSNAAWGATLDLNPVEFDVVINGL